MTTSFETTKAAWDALSADEQGAYRDEYQAQIISSQHDAGNHPFHAIFEQENQL